ncbi:MAG TPA: GGDEF domain-containing protein [Gaiellaceae bacterium]|nr:GGDEF domain-containing protein [Gaiellaceae bacterium]
MGAYAERVRVERPARPRLPGHARPFLWSTLVLALGVAAATSFASASGVRWRDFAVVAVAAALAQAFAAHTAANQVFHTGLAFTVAAALLLPPELVVVVAVAQHVPDWARQRYPWFIQSFNMANFVLSGLAAWAVRDALAGSAVGTGAGAVAAAACAAATFVTVNHLLLARMLRVARGHSAAASGLFSFDGLITDVGLAATGVAVAFALLREPALAPVVALPLVLIQRAVAVPTLREQAFRDHKTGLLNSRGIDQAARDEFARARRLDRELSILLCDIDDLRGINNEHGHLQGDAALVALADAFRAVLRRSDLCARFGGDEFLVVLPETGREDALRVAGRIQEWLGAHATPGSPPVRVSIGAAACEEHEQRLGDVIARADAAMYEAKHAGRSSFVAVG